jgi:hypothetical protein
MAAADKANDFTPSHGFPLKALFAITGLQLPLSFVL